MSLTLTDVIVRRSGAESRCSLAALPVSCPSPAAAASLLSLSSISHLNLIHTSRSNVEEKIKFISVILARAVKSSS